MKLAYTGHTHPINDFLLFWQLNSEFVAGVVVSVFGKRLAVDNLALCIQACVEVWRTFLRLDHAYTIANQIIAVTSPAFRHTPIPFVVQGDASVL